MKVLDTPRTGKVGTTVFYLSPFGQCCRSLVVPRDPRSQAQSRMREIFGVTSRGYGLKLTDPQRERWILAAQTVPTHPSLNEYSRLSGQQLCVKINSTLRLVGQPPVNEPPAPVVFSPNCVGDLTIDYDQAGNLRLRLAVGTAVEDLMLFGQAPCSAGRMKHRRVAYLGLLGPVTDGQCDITAAYVARHGQPRPGQKVFVVTCQHKNGWKAQDHLTSAIVPPKPLQSEQQRSEGTKVEDTVAAETPAAQTAVAQGLSSLSRAMYKGSTPDAQGMHKLQPGEHRWSILCTPLVHSFRMAMGRLAALKVAWA
ncbi:MAG TPA: hypothetical protein VN648_21785 [Candidatus Methylomirabilis sp.]|nr:hypothetical protein [Candidatus Methylomirabilis sp.]